MQPTPFSPCVPITRCWGLGAGPPPSANVTVVPVRYIHHVTVDQMYTVVLPWLLVLAALLIYSRRLRRFVGRVILFAFFMGRP